MDALHEGLQEAIDKKNALLILKLLDIDLKPSDKDIEGYTIVNLILHNDNLIEKMVPKILEIFLDDGIDPNIENSRGERALHLAVAKRMTDAIDLLIECDATINADRRSFVTHYFVKDEYKTFWNITDSDEREVAEVQTASFVDWMISRGFDFHLRNNQTKESAYDLAVRNHLLHVVTAVLKNTKDIQFNRDIEYRGQKLIEDPLFADGWIYISKNCPNPDWHRDYRLRHVTKIVKMLLVAGPTERERLLLLDLALRSNEPSVVEILTNHFPEGCDKRDLATSMFHHIMCRLKMHNYSPCELTIMSDLIARGADVNDEASDFHGRTPLHWAVDVKNIRVVEFLKDKNADFHAVDDMGSNLLHTLAEKCVPRIGIHKEVEELLDTLVNEGVQVNAMDKRGRTPLQVAADSKNWTIARGLIFHGAGVDGIAASGRQFYQQWLKEIGVLKGSFVDGRTSLYRLLRMHPNEGYIYSNNENLHKIVNSSNLRAKFPEYSCRILLGYNEAKGRSSLVERAKEAWLALTEMVLPDECIERIFVYLSNKDLETVIEGWKRVNMTVSI